MDLVTMKVRVLLLVLLTFLPAFWSWADGGYVSEPESVAISADQRAILIKNGDEISMTLSTGYTGEGEDFGWIIPTPVPPSIEHVFEAGEDGEAAFDILDKRTAPVVRVKTYACFPAGTEVLTADGPQAIETIIPGTKVHSYDLSKREWVFREVLGRQTHQYEGDMITVRLGDIAIQATGNHPFYVQRGAQLTSRPFPEDVPIEEQQITDQGRWVEARDLLQGDMLLGTGGEGWVITDVASRYESTEVHNLSVEGNHNYAVHRVGILVHNKGGAEATEPEALVTVYGRVTLEHYEVSVLGAADASALLDWLHQNNYKIDPSAKEVFDTYINKDWVFIALKLNPGEKRHYDNELLPPITIQYQSKHLDYPLRISSVSTTNTVKITLFVIAESTVISSNFRTTELKYKESLEERFVPDKYIETCIQNTLAAQEGGLVVMWSGKADFSNDEQTVVNKLVQSPLREGKIMYLTRLESRMEPTEMVDDIAFLSDPQPREYSIHINTRYGYGSELLLAAQNGEIDTVQRLLETGEDVNEKGSDGSTALVWAAREGHAEIVQVLLDAGADVNAVSKGGWRALNWAVDNGHSEIVQILLQAGADVNAKDERYKNRYTPLMMGAHNWKIDYWKFSDDHRESIANAMQVVVQELLNVGADVNATVNNGETALIRAVQLKCIEQTAIVKTLIDAGANVNAKDKNGRTTLMYARENGHTEIVELLKQAGAEE